MNRRRIFNVLLSFGVSLLLLGLLLNGFGSSANPADRPRLWSILADASKSCIGLYAFSNICQTFMRTLRYRLVLASSDGQRSVPSLFHLFVVTMSRNMFVDMLPARLGELSYVAMLNRGFQVSAEACLSSLAISFVFDLMALALLILGIIGFQLAFADLGLWLIGTFLAILALSVLLLLFLFPVLQWLSKRLARFQSSGWAMRLVQLTEDTAASLEQVRRAKIFGRVLALSICVRLFKYLGLYLLFLGIVLPSFPDIVQEPASVLIALVSAEAGSALPVPAFMSFGTYEAGGALALTALGAAASTSTLVMLALHIWSQGFDYLFGIIATIAFIFAAAERKDAAAEQPDRRRTKWLWLLMALAILGVGLIVFAVQVRSFKKMGSLRPPRPGEAVPIDRSQQSDSILAGLQGFVVWSSNRFGNHDLVMLTLPDRQLTQLTNDPHTEYFPRISPDGEKVVFSRSQVPWVSQRNKHLWDAWLLDLSTRKTTLLAKNANTPTWSADGRKIYFQRQANQFVEHDLASNKEVVIFETGKNLPLDASLHLETPAWSESRQTLAATIRKGGPVATYVIGSDRTVREVGSGCELNWAPDSSFLYHVGHGKDGGNVFYKVNPDTLERVLWFDSPSDYSHEYFPKMANSGDILVFGASTGGHEHDTADYEIFLWPIGAPMNSTVRLSFHTGNDNWPDIFLR